MRRIPRLILAFAAGGLAAYFSYNALCLGLDPYNVVWNRHEMPHAVWLHEQFRYHKTEHLRHFPDVYDTIVFGNSRGFDARTALLDRVAGRRIYNYSVSSDYPLGYWMKLRWAAQTQKKLKDVVLLLWYDQFMMAGTNYTVLIAREHPLVSGESWLSYYWAFSELPFAAVKPIAWFYARKIAGLRDYDRKVVDNDLIAETGDWVMTDPNLDHDENERRKYEQRVAKSQSGRLQFRSRSLPASEQEPLMQSLKEAPLQELQKESFKQLMAYLRNSGLHYHCVIPAMKADVVNFVPREKYAAWVRFVLEQCGEAWDFSLPNSITTDGFNYHDWSHFYGYVGYMMEAKVLGANIPELEQHTDFGRLLTAGDADRYASMLQASMDWWRTRSSGAITSAESGGQAPAVH